MWAVVSLRHVTNVAQVSPLPSRFKFGLPVAMSGAVLSVAEGSVVEGYISSVNRLMKI